MRMPAAIYDDKTKCDLNCYKKCKLDLATGVIELNYKTDGEDENTEYLKAGVYYCPTWYSLHEVGWNYIELTIFVIFMVLIVAAAVFLVIYFLKCRGGKGSSSSGDKLHPISS